MLYQTIFPQVNLSPGKGQVAPTSPLQPVKFPEDLQIILRSDRSSYGNLYIGNLEAAQNSQLLQSRTCLMKVCR